MILEFFHRVMLLSNHTNPTNKIQMLSREIAVLMINLEMKFQIFFFLAMTQQTAQVAFDASQGFRISGKILDILIVEVIFIMIFFQVILHGWKVGFIMEGSRIAKPTNEGHVQMPLTNVIVDLLL